MKDESYSKLGLVSIQGHEVHQIEYKGEPVLTTAQLAGLLGTNGEAIRQNFSRNRDQFQAEEHFIKLEGEDLKEFRDYMTRSHVVTEDLKEFRDYLAESGVVGPKPRSRHFNLWTMKGAILHVKISDSPRAWAVYHDMVQVYFGESPPLPERTEAPAQLTTKEIVQELKAFAAAAKFFKLEGNQTLLSANNAVRSKYGVDLMEQMGITHLETEDQQQIFTPSELGRQMGVSGIKINQLLAYTGLQIGHRDQKNRLKWTVRPQGEDHAVLLDTQKKHSDGTPVIQIKWKQSVMAEIEDLLLLPEHYQHDEGNIE